MLLTYLKRPLDYAQLLERLKIKPYGAPAGNIRLLVLRANHAGQITLR